MDAGTVNCVWRTVQALDPSDPDAISVIRGLGTASFILSRGLVEIIGWHSREKGHVPMAYNAEQRIFEGVLPPVTKTLTARA